MYRKKTENRPWTQADIDRIETLLREGFNPRQIGERLNRTRNAVIGTIWRREKLRDANRERVRGMTREERWPNIWAKGEAPQRSITKPVLPKQPPSRMRADEYDAQSLKLSLVDIGPSQCRFIAGYDHLMCGWPVCEGSRYCEHHMLRCQSSVRVVRAA
jgi:hypothetical protein